MGYGPLEILLDFKVSPLGLCKSFICDKYMTNVNYYSVIDIICNNNTHLMSAPEGNS